MGGIVSSQLGLINFGENFMRNSNVSLRRIILGMSVGLMGMALAMSAMDSSAATGYWDAPKTREDGTRMYKAELRGYEIQYWKVAEGESKKKVIAVPNGNSYKAQIPLEPNVDYVVQIAAVDLSGTYSKWVTFPKK